MKKVEITTFYMVSVNLVLDSWGKFPSGFFDGNFYEFGAFSQCFHIERNGEIYDTQYCLGNLILNLDNLNPTSRSHEFNLNHFNVPFVWQTEDQPTITPRLGLAPLIEGINVK